MSAVKVAFALTLIYMEELDILKLCFMCFIENFIESKDSCFGDFIYEKHGVHLVFFFLKK